MREIVKKQISAGLELSGTGPSIPQHVGITMTGIDINPFEILVRKFTDLLVGQALVTFHPRVGAHSLVELRVVEIDDVQFAGRVPGQNFPGEFTPESPELGDAAVARQTIEHSEARAAEPAITDQLVV